MLFWPVVLGFVLLRVIVSFIQGFLSYLKDHLCANNDNTIIVAHA